MLFSVNISNWDKLLLSVPSSMNVHDVSIIESSTMIQYLDSPVFYFRRNGEEHAKPITEANNFKWSNFVWSLVHKYKIMFIFFDTFHVYILIYRVWPSTVNDVIWYSNNIQTLFTVQRSQFGRIPSCQATIINKHTVHGGTRCHTEPSKRIANFLQIFLLMPFIRWILLGKSNENCSSTKNVILRWINCEFLIWIFISDVSAYKCDLIMSDNPSMNFYH